MVLAPHSHACWVSFADGEDDDEDGEDDDEGEEEEAEERPAGKRRRLDSRGRAARIVQGSEDEEEDEEEGEEEDSEDDSEGWCACVCARVCMRARVHARMHVYLCPSHAPPCCLEKAEHCITPTRGHAFGWPT